MTTHSPIGSSEYQPDAPLTALLAERMVLNPIAALEGAAGAPRLQLPALERPTAGTTVRSRSDTAVSASGAVFETAYAFGFIQTGTVRVTFDHRDPTATLSEAQIVRTRNGTDSVMAAWSNTTSSYVTRSADINIIPGDLIAIQHKAGSATADSNMRNMRFQTDGERLWPAVAARLE